MYRYDILFVQSSLLIIYTPKGESLCSGTEVCGQVYGHITFQFRKAVMPI